MPTVGTMPAEDGIVVRIGLVNNTTSMCHFLFCCFTIDVAHDCFSLYLRQAKALGVEFHDLVASFLINDGGRVRGVVDDDVIERDAERFEVLHPFQVVLVIEAFVTDVNENT